eukprot:gb/GECG01011390.1/.p1 GENE.gb/GECG01011390.1/~~gb/GECG01011390.1/.p1  ORF type:complete len:124 (+),score=6.44 gb/GECG01011390.1/:1-372(+)
MKMLVQSAGRALLRCINRPLTVSRAVQRTCAYQTSTIHLQEQATEARHSSQQHHKQQFKEEAPKTTTAVTGLPVDINWRDTLSELYHKTLEEVKVCCVLAVFASASATCVVITVMGIPLRGPL